MLYSKIFSLKKRPTDTNSHSKKLQNPSCIHPTPQLDTNAIIVDNEMQYNANHPHNDHVPRAMPRDLITLVGPNLSEFSNFVILVRYKRVYHKNFKFGQRQGSCTLRLWFQSLV